MNNVLSYKHPELHSTGGGLL